VAPPPRDLRGLPGLSHEGHEMKVRRATGGTGRRKTAHMELGESAKSSKRRMPNLTDSGTTKRQLLTQTVDKRQVLKSLNYQTIRIIFSVMKY
jgi:hypothetical protein